MVMASSYCQTICFSKTAIENKIKPAPPRIFTSINPSDVKVVEVRELLRSANLSCHRFPKIGPDGKVEPVEVEKLSRAISHSTVVVSVFSSSKQAPFFPIPFQSITQSQRQLVGFGRAVSDHGLTASIHDVVVLPSLQGLGIGRRIVNRILRVLTSRGIYDISALCSENERCGGICGALRDMDGKVVFAFAQPVNQVTSVLQAEMKALLLGIKIAIRADFTSVEVESNCRQATSRILQAEDDPGPAMWMFEEF